MLGKGYTQLILRLVGGMRIGESFFTPLPKGYSFGKWEKPENEVCLMGDIKLKPEYWGQGLGTEGMQKVVEWLFGHTDCCLLVVPPHRKNPAAQRVYEKAGFELYRGMRSWRNHKVMKLSRERYKRINMNTKGCANQRVQLTRLSRVRGIWELSVLSDISLKLSLDKLSKAQ